MRRGVELLGDNKLAVVACVALVAALTGLGVWTNSTAERQGNVEKEVRVQHTEVVQALCDRPFTDGCLRRAVNIVKTCLANGSCARLLAEGPVWTGRKSSSRAKRENRGVIATAIEHRNSSSGISEPAPPPHHLAEQRSHRHHKKSSGPREVSSPPVPPPSASPAPPTPPSSSSPEPPVTNPAGNVPPGQQSPPPGAASGTGKAVGHAVECVAELDLNCAVGEIVAPRDKGN